ncbi:MAG: LuxR C-terminal-related transcriptional regulator [Gammaproteobacteria bacterium]|jgi:DNA-binding CsgD family transcriptional regulator
MDIRKRDLLGVLNIVHDCIDIQDTDDMKATLDRFSEIVPFSAAVMCGIEKSQSINKVFFSDIVNHSYNDRWGEIYFENDFIEVDPVVNYSLKTNQAFTWVNAFKNLDTQNRKAREFVTMAGDYQLRDGLAHTVGDRENGTLLSLSMEHPNNPYYTQILNHVTPHLHEAMQRINARSASVDLPELTHREYEVLQWTGEGKSSWEIGMILGISERTVKYHINNVKSKLNAVNRAHAVAKAFRFRLIT